MRQSLQISACAESVAEGAGHAHTPPRLRDEGQTLCHQEDPKQGQGSQDMYMTLSQASSGLWLMPFSKPAISS